jgi:O-antigen ligase
MKVALATGQSNEKVWSPTVASAVLLIGFTGVLLLWLPGPPWRPDQFTLPKEALLATVGFACAFQLLSHENVALHDPIERWFLLALFWGALLSASVAANSYLAWRELGTFAAALLVFSVARVVEPECNREQLYLRLSVLLAALTAVVLLEAFGGLPFFSEPGRRPGATLGNRNLIARLLCLWLPLLWRELAVIQKPLLRRAVAVTLTAACTTIVLTRSRGAWIIATLFGLTLLVAVFALRYTDSPSAAVRACLRWTLAISIGVALGLFIPNRMDWGPASFASSGSRILDYKSGTGRERVEQSRTTFGIFTSHPFWGIGPANWSIIYPEYAQRNDSSSMVDGQFSTPRVPRGDGLSLATEFGLPGVIFMGLGVISMLRRCASMIRMPDATCRFSGIAALACLFGAMLLGLIDPVVRSPATLFFLALVLGLLLSDAPHRIAQRSSSTARRWGSRGLLLACAAICTYTGNESVRDLVALQSIRSLKSVGQLSRTIAIAPHNAEARELLAGLLIHAGRCDLAKTQIAEVLRLRPFSRGIRLLREHCNQTASSRGPDVRTRHELRAEERQHNARPTELWERVAGLDGELEAIAARPEKRKG